jgi:heptosyltransferase-2
VFICVHLWLILFCTLVMLEAVGTKPPRMKKVLVRATNWLGDAVMSLPAVRAIREAWPEAHLAVVVRPGLDDFYTREAGIDLVIPCPKPSGLGDRFAFAAKMRAERFDGAILLPNSFDAALMAWLARIPVRIGYNRDGRGLLLTHAIAVPKAGEIPRHERFYYLELLRRAGLMERLPEAAAIRLSGAGKATIGGAPVVGISPGAAYGNAKRWLPERFAEAGALVARALGGSVTVFGSASERALCEAVAGGLRATGVAARNLAGETTLGEFIDQAAACRVFLTNDSGGMHIASALGVPTVAVFGATDDGGTGPAGPLARVVREKVDCAPCLLRECPIDHRCMTRVSAARVAETALELLEESTPAWTHEPKS